MNDYNWEGLNYLSKIEDWKRFEKSDPTIVLNLLYIKHIKEKDVQLVQLYVQLIFQKLIQIVKNN